VTQGRTLGGSSAINGLNYTRGLPIDFDGWAQMGNRGWSYSDLLPYFLRDERRISGANPVSTGARASSPSPIATGVIRFARRLSRPLAVSASP
jgi:choline dehydrogenase